MQTAVTACAITFVTLAAEQAPLWVRVPVLVTVLAVLSFLFGFLIRERARPFGAPRSGPAEASPSHPHPRTLINEPLHQRVLVISIGLGGLAGGLTALVTVGGRAGTALLLVISGSASIISQRLWARAVSRGVQRALDVSSRLDPDQRSAFLAAAERQWGRKATRPLRETSKPGDG
jgi:hypothetical protein